MRARPLAVAILALALILRLGLALAYDPPRPINDAVEYELHATALADFHSFFTSQIAPGPSAYRPPGYPMALAAFYELFGQGEDSPRVFGALVGTIAVGLLGLIGLWLFGARAALVAMALAALFPPLIMVSLATLTEGLFIALMLGSLAAALAYRHDERLIWVVTAGALAGAAALTRTNGLVLLVPLLLVVPRRRLVLLAAAVLVLLPWTIRNTTTFDTFVPTTTQTGFTLSGAYNDEARGDDRFPAAWRPPTMAPYDRILRDKEGKDEADLDREFRSEALSFAADHPLYVPRVVFWATVRMLNLADPELEELSGLEAGVHSGWVKLNRYSTWLLLALAVAGAVLARPPPWFWLFPLLLWLSVAIAIGATRYRTPIDPFLILLAAGALTSWRRA
jgi:4-amino-4-deoxy-L-arabinose transferase-like glycosyltransferase